MMPDARVIGNRYQDATAPLALQVVLCQHRVRLKSMADPTNGQHSAPMAVMPRERVQNDMIVTRVETRGPIIHGCKTNGRQEFKRQRMKRPSQC